MPCPRTPAKMARRAMPRARNRTARPVTRAPTARQDAVPAHPSENGLEGHVSREASGPCFACIQYVLPSAACAAASRATGRRNGEQLT